MTHGLKDVHREGETEYIIIKVIIIELKFGTGKGGIPEYLVVAVQHQQQSDN